MVDDVNGWDVANRLVALNVGAFENDDFRRAFLTTVAELAGSTYRPATSAPGFAARRETMIERLADAVEEHLDTAFLRRLLQV